MLGIKIAPSLPAGYLVGRLNPHGFLRQEGNPKLDRSSTGSPHHRMPTVCRDLVLLVLSSAVPLRMRKAENRPIGRRSVEIRLRLFASMTVVD
jgi:hypothetical protein